ncbi:MAG: 23S rRNA (adenine(2030)-N(6))-methyltransferase RlmJ [Betaproteobacteria bacterium]|nr:23S rRNA (adenine(2030)-N(6))-methyltransferase RlmJ [Betaproteobacteria bacterium]
MLSYRHLFHAGNCADVFKHALLTRLLAGLGRNPNPYFYLDTHAGIGRYDLTRPWAQKACEFENGIGRLWGRTDTPEALKAYMDLVRAENPDGKLRYYPGSPLIALRLRRLGDRMVFSELNKTDHAELEALVARERRVAVHLMDGYQALKAFLPPAERRGLVLIDSSFDRAREFPRLVRALTEAHERWATGMYAAWYPLMDADTMAAFERNLRRTGIRKILRLELATAPRDQTRVIPGSGMLVVNPPWHFDTEARPLLQWLWGALAVDGAGGTRVDWLVPE